MLKKITLAVCALMLAVSTFAQQQGVKNYQPTPENLAARKWFQDAKFGLFVHWGVYSELGDGEWVMNDQNIPISDYEKLPTFFNPVDFDPVKWVSLVKEAGMKYITITSKHHDGFAMYDSQVSDYNIVDATPYGKDIIKALKDECDKQGIKLFFYYSQLDWHHPDYYPLGRTAQGIKGRPHNGNWDAYLDYMNTQLTELLTNYGEIGGIWFDGMWDKRDADWKLHETYSLIHRLQPQTLIGSNHHLVPFPGEDFQMFERDLPGQNTAGHSGESEIGQLPLETCQTMNGAWGFNLQDNDFKSTRELLHYVIKGAGYNANFLLNVGPMPNGEIQPEFVQHLKEMGAWLSKNGETIYGTRGGPISPRQWGVTTQKDNKVYVHILDWADESLLLPKLDKKVKSANLFGSGQKVSFEDGKYGLVLNVPTAERDSVDTIVELNF